MDYTPLLDMPGWAAFQHINIFGPIMVIPLWIFLMCFCFEGHYFELKLAKKHPFFVPLIVFFITSVFALGSIILGNSISDKLGARYEQNLQIMKDNLATKYDMDTDALISDDFFNQPYGTRKAYIFETKNEASIGTFSVNFEESGEPFINVENDFTKELVEDLMR